MRTSTIVPMLLVAAAFAFVAGGALSQEGQQAPDEAKMMELWMKHAKPGEHHEALRRYLGKWDVESEMVMPGAPPQKSTGEAEFHWLMEGRWLQQDFHGTLMGMPYRGFGLTGWDNYKKKHVGMWCDSMNTTMLHFEGVPVDPTGKVIVMYGPMDEYMTGEHDKVVKYLTRFLDDDKFVFEIWDMAIGENGAAVMRLTYTRQKP